MSSPSHARVMNAFRLLADATIDRQNDINSCPTKANNGDSDHENDNSCYMFDQLYDSGGSIAIISMKQFPPVAFHRVWVKVETKVSFRYNIGTGNKSDVFRAKWIYYECSCFKEWGTMVIFGMNFRNEGTYFSKTHHAIDRNYFMWYVQHIRYGTRRSPSDRSDDIWIRRNLEVFNMRDTPRTWTFNKKIDNRGH